MDVHHLSEKVQCRLARVSCKEKVLYWIRRIGHPNGIQYRSDARSSTRSGSGAQSLSPHSVDVHPERISGSFVQHTEEYSEVLTPRGLPSTQVRLDKQKPSPEQVMVDISVLVAGHTMCSTETKVNDNE